jgi:hypothetical protein
LIIFQREDEALAEGLGWGVGLVLIKTEEKRFV